MTGDEVFEELKRTKFFVPETKKREILRSFWKECSANLTTRFRPDGMDAEGNNGFGFIIEEIARRSGNLPHNIPKAEHLAKLLIGTLHTGDETLGGTGRSLRNPDFIWVNLRGAHAQITGIGEVKASVVAYLSRTEQTLAQEAALKTLLASIAAGKEKGTAHEFFRNLTITIRDPLFKIMVVPHRSKKEFSSRIPKDWAVQEIEFSYEELEFIAQRLWPEFRKDAVRAGQERSPFELEFLEPYYALGEEVLNTHIYEEGGVPLRAILLFVLAAERLPTTETEIGYAVRLMDEFDGSLAKEPSRVLTESKLTRREQDMLAAHRLRSPGNDQHMLQFLARLREFRREFAAWCKKRGETERVQSLEQFTLHI